MNRPAAPRSGEAPGWTFFSNHTHVLVCLAQDPQARVRDLADRVGITERGVQNVLADLIAAGVLARRRVGRRNHYRINGSQHLRHPVEAHRTIAALLDMVLDSVPRRGHPSTARAPRPTRRRRP